MSARFLPIQVIAFCALGLQSLTTHAQIAEFDVHPRATFFVVGSGDEPENPLIIDLEGLSIETGDLLSLSSVGAFASGFGSPDDDSRLVAVFSTSATILPSNQTQRVVGAIDAGQDTFQGESCSPSGGNVVQDIPEDFEVLSQPVNVFVPDGARYLVVGTRGCWFRDQTDPNNDFGIRVEKPEKIGSTVPENRLAIMQRGLNREGSFLFPEDLLGTPISLKDIQLMQGEGFSLLRLFLSADVFLPQFADSQTTAEAWEILDQVIESWISAGMGVSVMLSAGGFVSSSIEVLGTEEGRASYLDFTSQLAERYAHIEPDLFFFEVTNEPHDITALNPDCDYICTVNEWRDLQGQFIERVRQHTTQHTILVSGPDFSNYPSLIQLAPYQDTNLVYLFHYYYPHVFTFPHQEPQAIELYYPACMPENQGVTNSITDEFQLQITQEYLENNWNYQRIYEDIQQVARYRDAYDVAVINNEFGSWSLNASIDGDPPIENRLRWIRDTRMVSERLGIPWNVYDVSVYFDFQSGPDGEFHSANAYKLQAVGARPWSLDEPDCTGTGTPEADLFFSSKAISNTVFDASGVLARHTLTNNGPDMVHNASFRMPISEDLKVRFASPGDGVCDVHRWAVICDVGDIPAGNSVPIVVSLQFESPSIETSAHVVGHEKDPNPENNDNSRSWNQSSAGEFRVDWRMSGSFYDPEHDGEGWLLEILSEESTTEDGVVIPGRALAYWFTYQASGGNQLWLIAEGEIRGNTIFFRNALNASGPIFGAGFDPADAVFESWGDFWMIFGSPDVAQVGWNSRTTGYGASRLNASRLSQPAGITGSVQGDFNPGYSGSWYDPSHNGEGWLIEVLEDGRVVIYWFTYDRNGDPVWLLGVGNLEGATFEAELIQVTGPEFGSGFDPEDAQPQEWGTVEFTFQSCNSATMAYTSAIPGFGSGSLNPTRLTALVGVDCE